MTIPILISIRNTSTRLPGKCLADLAGKPSIQRQVERLARSVEADAVVVATSTTPEDDVLAETAAAIGVPCVRGAVDKLPRYMQAADELAAEFVIVVDGDDVLADGEQIDRLIRACRDSLASEPLDYALVDGLPVGATGFAIRSEAGRRVLELRSEDYREVWGPYFVETGLFRTAALDPDDERLRRQDIRLTLDYEEDLQVFRAIFEHFGEQDFSLLDIVAFLDAHPDVAALNRDAQTRYEANIAAHTTPVRLG